MSFSGGLYTSLWISYVYFNMRIVTRDGDEIPVREAVGNFLKSPAFTQFRSNVAELWGHAWEHGFFSTLQQLIDSLDPLGEKNALRVRTLRIYARCFFYKSSMLQPQSENPCKNTQTTLFVSFIIKTTYF